MAIRPFGQALRADHEKPRIAASGCDPLCAREKAIEPARLKVSRCDEADQGRTRRYAEHSARPRPEPRGVLQREAGGTKARIVDDDAVGRESKMLDQRSFRELRVRDERRSRRQTREELALVRDLVNPIVALQMATRFGQKTVHEDDIRPEKASAVIDEHSIRSGARCGGALCR